MLVLINILTLIFFLLVCYYKTFIQDVFMIHLDSHKDRSIKCQSCISVVPKHAILQHMLTHRFGLYECVYCFYGSMSLESIRLHMAMVHPSSLLYVTARLKRNEKDKVSDLRYPEKCLIIPGIIPAFFLFHRHWKSLNWNQLSWHTLVWTLTQAWSYVMVLWHYPQKGHLLPININPVLWLLPTCQKLVP